MTTRLPALVTFEYRDFDGQRKHADAKSHADAFGEGFYIMGKLGCGKTRPTVREALIAYLGGRELVCHQDHGQ